MNYFLRKTSPVSLYQCNVYEYYERKPDSLSSRDECQDRRISDRGGRQFLLPILSMAPGLRPWSGIVFCLLILFLTEACSIQKFVVDELSNALTGSESSDVFMGENDPQLVADSLPFAIKLYETLLSMNPDHEGLLRTTGSLYIMYANAFIQGPALMLPVEDYDKRAADLKRAQNLYIRGRNILASSIEMRYPGFTEALLSNTEIEVHLEKLNVSDVPDLYWLVSGWFALLTIDSFDVQVLLRIPSVLQVLEKAYQLDPEFNDGAFEELFISVYAALPKAMGGGYEKAIQAFEKAVELKEGAALGPYVSLALSVAYPQQNKELFIELMEMAISIDVDAYPKNRLINTIMRERAQWYLENIDDFFI